MDITPITIFISYSRTNSAFAHHLEGDLNKAGYNTWIDRNELEGGQHWLKEIQQAIQQSRFLVVILSPEAVISEYVEIEYTYALSIRKTVIPVLYQPCETPIRLILKHLVDFYVDYNIGFSNLLKSLTRQEIDLSETEVSLQISTKQQVSFDITNKLTKKIKHFYTLLIMALCLLTVFGSIFFSYISPKEKKESPSILATITSVASINNSGTATILPSLTVTGDPTSSVNNTKEGTSTPSSIKSTNVPSSYSTNTPYPTSTKIPPSPTATIQPTPSGVAFTLQVYNSGTVASTSINGTIIKSTNGSVTCTLQDTIGIAPGETRAQFCIVPPQEPPATWNDSTTDPPNVYTGNSPST